MTEKSENKMETICGHSGLPTFRIEEKNYLLLNLGMDVDTGDVIYHLHSVFSEKAEMGAVIDTIELEHSQRQTA